MFVHFTWAHRRVGRELHIERFFIRDVLQDVSIPIEMSDLPRVGVFGFHFLQDLRNPIL